MGLLNMFAPVRILLVLGVTLGHVAWAARFAGKAKAKAGPKAKPKPKGAADLEILRDAFMGTDFAESRAQAALQARQLLAAHNANLMEEASGEVAGGNQAQAAESTDAAADHDAEALQTLRDALEQGNLSDNSDGAATCARELLDATNGNVEEALRLITEVPGEAENSPSSSSSASSGATRSSAEIGPEAGEANDVLDVPEVAANVLGLLDVPGIAAIVCGALGTGEGGLLLRTLSRARKQHVAEMQAALVPEVQPPALRVGKLVAAIDGMSATQSQTDFRNWWNSLPADLRAEKQVVLVAIRSATNRLHRQSLVSEYWWNSLPTEVRADKDVVLAAIRSELWRGTPVPSWWNSLSSEVRADKDVVLAAIRSSLWRRSPVNWWNSLSPEVQAMPDVVAAAIECGLKITTREEWGSLPAEMRATKQVILAAASSFEFLRRLGRPFAPPFEHWWNSLPPAMQVDKDVVLAAVGSPREFSNPEHWWNSLATEVRADKDVVRAAIGAHVCERSCWNSLPTEVRADKDVVVAAIISGLITIPEQWNSLPADLQANKRVVSAAMNSLEYARAAFMNVVDFEQWWKSLPATVQTMPDLVAEAIRLDYISTPEQWDSLPDGVRADKKVALAAIRSATRYHPWSQLWFAYIASEHWWNSLPDEVRTDEDVVSAIRSNSAFRFEPS
eukprot:g9722.t1